MRVIDTRKRRKTASEWLWIGYTTSESAAWSFDSLKLLFPHSETKIGLFSLDDTSDYGAYNSAGQAIIDLVTPTYGEKPFNSTNGAEHDFTFNLSWNTDVDIWKYVGVAIKGIPKTAEFQKIYGALTGLPGTRGKSAEMIHFNLGSINTGPSVGGEDTSLIFSGTGLVQLDFYTNGPKAIYAKTVKFDDCNFTAAYLDKLLQYVNAGNQWGGLLDYSNQRGTNPSPTTAAQADYDALISRGWTILGKAPVAAINPQVSAYLNAIAIPNNSTVVHKTKTGAEIWTWLDAKVKEAISEGYWNDIICWHPMLGATAAKHGKNIKDISRYEMTFYGSWIIDQTGNKPPAQAATYASYNENPFLEITDYKNVGWTLAWSGTSTTTSFLNGAVDANGTGARLGYIIVGSKLSIDIHHGSSWPVVGDGVVRAGDVATAGRDGDNGIVIRNNVQDWKAPLTKPDKTLPVDIPHYGARNYAGVVSNPANLKLTSVMYHTGQEAKLYKFNKLVKDWENFLTR
jgi:hypothetical protein